MTSIADELDRLAAHREAGRLDDAEFAAAKARLLSSPSASHSSSGDERSAAAEALVGADRLRRSPTDRWIGGVCGGIARWLGIEAWIVRLAFVLSVVCVGFGLIPYVLLWIFVPLEGR